MSALSEKRRFNRISANFRFWHKATIHGSGTFSDSRGVNFRQVLRNSCNEEVNIIPRVCAAERLIYTEVINSSHKCLLDNEARIFHQ